MFNRMEAYNNTDKIVHVAMRLRDAMGEPVNLTGAIADCVIIAGLATELRFKLQDAKEKREEPTT